MNNVVNRLRNRTLFKTVAAASLALALAIVILGVGPCRYTMQVSYDTTCILDTWTGAVRFFEVSGDVATKLPIQTLPKSEIVGLVCDILVWSVVVLASAAALVFIPGTAIWAILHPRRKELIYTFSLRKKWLKCCAITALVEIAVLVIAVIVKWILLKFVGLFVPAR